MEGERVWSASERVVPHPNRVLPADAGAADEEALEDILDEEEAGAEIERRLLPLGCC